MSNTLDQQILGTTRAFNLAYAIAIADISQVTLQTIIQQHASMANNIATSTTSIALILPQLPMSTTSVTSILDSGTLVDPEGKFFHILEFEFLVKNFEFFFATCNIFLIEG